MRQWTQHTSVDVEQEDVIGPNRNEQEGISFVLDWPRYCAVVGRVVLSKESFHDRYHVEKRRHSGKGNW